MNDEKDSKSPQTVEFEGETQLPNSSPESNPRRCNSKRHHDEAFDEEPTLDPFMAKQHRQSTERYLFKIFSVLELVRVDHNLSTSY